MYRGDGLYKDYTTPLYKGFNDLIEALDYVRGNIGPNYYITPTLRPNMKEVT